jgi:hypothetical protein
MAAKHEESQKSGACKCPFPRNFGLVDNVDPAWSKTMSVNATHRGISYKIAEARGGGWQWSFTPPVGPSRSGRVTGDIEWAATVVRRAIDVWRLMNRGGRDEAA